MFKLNSLTRPKMFIMTTNYRVTRRLSVLAEPTLVI
jgi:hypothetical protein